MAEKSPTTSDTAIKERIIKHMNSDHQDSLIRYLEHFCHLSSFSARNAHLTDITFDHLVISTYPGSTHIVPIHPSMTSWSDARPRVVAMDAEAVAGLNRSNITVKKYTLPVGLMWLHIIFTLTVLIVLWRPENLHPGSSVYDHVLVHGPGFARFCLQVRWLVFFVVFTFHPAEALYMHTSRLRKHTVPTFSALWWMWMASCSVEGYTAFIRFNRIVAEEERKKADAKH